LFGLDLDDQADKIGRDLTFVLDYVHAGPRRTFSASQRNQFHYAKRGLNLQIKRIVEKRREAQRAGEDNHRDLLSVLLSMRDINEEHISIRQLHDEMMTFIFTGHETTAIALAWTWYLLSLHPECEARLHDEVGRVLNGRAPTTEDLPNLPYTRMVFQEALRLYPPVWGIARQTTQDEEIGGYHIPAKSTLSVLPFVTHRHPEFWPNPEAFDPERFTPNVLRSASLRLFSFWRRRAPVHRQSLRDDGSAAHYCRRGPAFSLASGSRTNDRPDAVHHLATTPWHLDDVAPTLK
jgi:cytochrome P450